MRHITRIATSIKDVFDYNSSTLSGALDVIVIKHEDGSLHCSPFHVRFGKWKVFKSREKQVTIRVNGVRVSVPMKLGSSGEAFFVEEADGGVEDALVTSPIVEPSDSPQSPVASGERLDPDVLLPPMSLKPPGKASPETPDHPKKPGFFGRITGFFKKNPSKSQPTLADDSIAQFSLCREAIEQGADAEVAFSKGIVPWEVFRAGPWEVLGNRDLVVKFDGKLLDWNTAAPLIFAQIVYSQTLEIPPEDPSEGRASPTQQSPPPEEEPKALLSSPQQQTAAYRKTVTLSSDSLKLLRLQPGSNDVTYTVRSRIQGEHSLEGKIYLWDSWTKIVISDIDGTITRSDMLGHFLPLVGKDWSHKGICRLYSSIIKNGYQLLYLSARAIGQVGRTKDYLESLNQDNRLLPDGPVMTSPDRLFDSFVREVITKEPHLFKSHVLKKLAELFPRNRYPLYAGFGNRETDEIAYHSAGISSDRTFTINPSGDIVNGHGVRTTYPHLSDLVDHIFPPVDSKVHTAREALADTEFSSGMFWRVPVPHLLPEDLLEPL